MDAKALFNGFFVPTGLDGSCLDFNKLEQTKASVTFEIVLAEVNRRTLVDVQAEPDTAKVEAIKENLGKILDLFGTVREARNEFLSNYTSWRKIRERSIEKLMAYGKAMHKDQFHCNVARIVGSSIAVVGGAAMIAGAVISPSSATTLAGGGASLVGGGVVAGTSLTKYGLVKKKMKKAKKILRKDQEAFQAMKKWFERTLDLEEAVEAVVGFQVMKTIAKGLKDFANDFKSNNATRFRKTLKKILDFLLDTNDNLVASVGIQLTSIILTFCVVVVISPNYDVLDSVILTNCMVLGLLSGLDFGVEVGRGIVMAVKGGTVAAGISSEVARTVFHGVLGGIGLTLNLINIVLVSIDIHKGSLSKQGTQILNASRKLDDELEFLDKVYARLVLGAARTIAASKMSHIEETQGGELEMGDKSIDFVKEFLKILNT